MAWHKLKHNLGTKYYNMATLCLSAAQGTRLILKHWGAIGKPGQILIEVGSTVDYNQILDQKTRQRGYLEQSSKVFGGTELVTEATFLEWVRQNVSSKHHNTVIEATGEYLRSIGIASNLGLVELDPVMIKQEEPKPDPVVDRGEEWGSWA